MKKKRVKVHFGNLLLLLIVVGALGYGVYYMVGRFKTDNSGSKIDTKSENKLVKKLKDLGYESSDAENIVLNLKEEDVNNISKKYNNLASLSKVKYFHIENIDRYEKVMKDGKYDAEETVMRVNTHIDREFYTDIKQVDNGDDLLVLVNKYYQLPDDYVPKDLVSVGNGQKLQKRAADDFLKMMDAIHDAGLPLIAQSGYRSIDLQRTIYKNQVNRKGSVEKADAVSARAGHSEHHTGLAMDVSVDGTLEKSFENTKQFKWLEENAYKYGFIMRYPKDKIYMTGYDYEPWHYRYVGVEVATLIHTEGITYEEYAVKYLGLY